ncbi:MAG TPA: hypothetical protein VN729_09275 [Ktedonobacteraceae bacterium]|nr:hypothetical protein [Ktedonobacteraceae bacterium]
MTAKKIIYQVLLFFALVGSGFFYANLPFPDASFVVFHVNTFPVTWRLIADIALIAVLIYLFLLSGRNYLVGVDAKHSTVISKR